MNTRDSQYDTVSNEVEGVSAPYRVPPVTGRMPRPSPSIALRADWYEQEVVRTAGVHATWLWLCACGAVRQRGGDPYLSLTDLRRLVDFEELGVKAKVVIERGKAAGLFAETKTGVIVLTDALDDRRR